MGSQTSVGVRLEPDSAKAGDEVSGTVFLQVAEDTSATHIDVQVIGREKTKVKYTHKSGKENPTARRMESRSFCWGVGRLRPSRVTLHVQGDTSTPFLARCRSTWGRAASNLLLTQANSLPNQIHAKFST